MSTTPPGGVAHGLAQHIRGQVLAPGHPQTGCVSVSAAGATPSDAVVLSATGVAGSLAQYLSVSVQVEPELVN